MRSRRWAATSPTIETSWALFEWYFNSDAALVDGGPCHVLRASADDVRPMWNGIGSMVIGRHLFDLTNGRQGVPRRASTWSWYRIGPRRKGGARRRRTTSST